MSVDVSNWFEPLPGRYVNPVQLDYEFHPHDTYPHWIVMRDGTINDEYYDMVFNLHHEEEVMEFRAWMVQQFGPGGRLGFKYVNLRWFCSERDRAVCFTEEKFAVMFKLRWG
jgi:hypothetical protein